MTGPVITSGHDRRLCGADTSDEENPDKTCGLPAGWGTEHKGIGRCRKHLGNTRNHIEAARRQQILELAAEQLDNPDAPPLEDAADALRRLATRVEMAVDAVGARVNDLNSMRYSADGAGTEQIRAEVQVWLQLLARSESLLKNIHSLGLTELAIRIDEQRGLLLAGAVQRILDRLELSDEQRVLVPIVVPEELRATSALEGRVS